MNFVTMLEEIEESTFFAFKDVTLSVRFIKAGVGGCPSCLTVGFDPRSISFVKPARSAAMTSR